VTYLHKMISLETIRVYYHQCRSAFLNWSSGRWCNTDEEKKDLAEIQGPVSWNLADFNKITTWWMRHLLHNLFDRLLMFTRTYLHKMTSLETIRVYYHQCHSAFLNWKKIKCNLDKALTWPRREKNVGTKTGSVIPGSKSVIRILKLKSRTITEIP
jgi:hypothetical protein